VRAIYPIAKTSWLTGAMDLTSDVIEAQLVGGYTYSPTHTAITDITGAIDVAQQVTGIAVDAGVARCDDVTFPAVGGIEVITGIVIYRTDGTLISFCDQRADTVPLNIEPTGDDLTFSFDYLVKI
jgi:hypothetical protein